MRGPKGPFDWDLSRGTEVHLTQVTAALKYEIADGWRLQETLRYRTSESKRIGLFPNAPVLGSARIAQYHVALLAAAPGATDVQLRYTTNPNEVFNTAGAGQNGNGLVLDGSLRYVSVPLDELISDTRLLHKFEIGGQSHDVTPGGERIGFDGGGRRQSRITAADIPATTLDMAELCVLDWFDLAIGGPDEPATRLTREVAAAEGA
ncbi:MAG TPA: hypothetical protein VNZ85_17780, partial [Caulobacter sp.]|nr:hypothetical protein [Caulobacter sp.]